MRLGDRIDDRESEEADATMLVAGSLFALARRPGGHEPSRLAANACFFSLLASSLAFYGVTLYLGLHEGRLVVDHGLTPEQAERATPLHPYLIMVAGIGMFASFWLLLATIARAFLRTRSPLRPFALAGCAALAVGTLQGPVQAFPAVNDLLDRGGDAGDVVVNLHAQLNMLGGLMLILLGLAFVALRDPGRAWPVRESRRIVAWTGEASVRTSSAASRSRCSKPDAWRTGRRSPRPFPRPSRGRRSSRSRPPPPSSSAS